MAKTTTRTGRGIVWACAIALALCGTGEARRCLAQQLVASAPESAYASTPVDSAVVVPDARYRAHFLHRWLLGANHRDSWATPERAPVLDLATFAGGLKTVGLGGGAETWSLHLLGRDGREYRFRPIDKDPSRGLPADLKSSVVKDLYQDNISSEYPGAPALVAPLLRAAGVLHVDPQLFVMPDDPALGEYRARFRGALGYLEVRPRTGMTGDMFSGATRIASTETLLKEISRSAANRVDARAYLAARLVDMYVGDWDRGSQQWLWARFGRKHAYVWRPIPRDRDAAFSNSDGLLIDIARPWAPYLIKFGDEYPNMIGLMGHSWTLDRHLLQELDRATWDSTAAALQRSLTDSVIDDAVMHLPSALRERDGAWLTRALRRRRQGLPEVAGKFYSMVARDADVRATAEPTLVQISRDSDGGVDLSLAARYGTAADLDSAPYYHRRFARSETEEIRLYLGKGPDSVVVRGAPQRALKVRIITGRVAAVVIDSTRLATGHDETLVYDASGRSRISPSYGVPVDRRTYRGPTPSDTGSLVRDEGDSTGALPWLNFSSDLGLFAGASLTHVRRGFRQVPFAQRHTLRAGYASTAKGFRAEYDGEFRGTGSSTLWSVHAAASELDLLRYYGIGNETSDAGPDALYRIRDGGYRDYTASVGFTTPLTDRASLSLGPFLRYSQTKSGSATLLEQTRPYGSGSFGVVGLQLDAQLDTRDSGEADPRRGLLFRVGGSASPAWWDATSAYGELHGEARTYLTAATLPTTPTLALRVGGQKGWRDTPFQDLAYLGGGSTLGGASTPLRGFHADRFAGRSMLYGNAELRSRLGHVNVLLPAQLGVFALADVGRVYAPGESSDRWHSAVGGGLWLAFLNGRHLLSASAAHSAEGTNFYVHSGFAF